jgi:hypothetical protein
MINIVILKWLLNKFQKHTTDTLIEKGGIVAHTNIFQGPGS